MSRHTDLTEPAGLVSAGLTDDDLDALGLNEGGTDPDDMLDLEASLDAELADGLDDAGAGADGVDLADAGEDLEPDEATFAADPVHQTLEVLNTAVRAVVGSPEAAARPGQAALTTDLARTLADTGALAGVAPTGVGKSLSYLSAAATAAALRGERSVVSTESLALQAQIIDKDAPVVADACYEVTGYRPTVAVHKGWSNYVCASAALETGREVAAATGIPNPTGKPGESVIAELRRLASALSTAQASGRRLTHGSAEVASVTTWALNEVVDGHATGDKNSYPGELTDNRSWDAVSVSSSDCLGAKKCPLAEWCLPRAARQRAADADIVVTNHTLLGIQAAKDVPVVIASKTLGTFHNVIVDEAHGLPSAVRNQGSVEISARRVNSVVIAVGKVLDERDKNVATMLAAGKVAAEEVGKELSARTRSLKEGGVSRMGEENDPLEDSGDLLRAWVKAATRLVGEANKSTTSTSAEIKLRRALGRLTELDDSARLVREHRPGVARWVEVVVPPRTAAMPEPFPAVRYTPVDVASMLANNVWSAPVPEDEEADEPTASHEAGGGDPEEQPRYQLNVALLSATLPTGFTRQAGVKAIPQHYASPFDDAYGASVLFVPRAVDEPDVSALAFPGAPKPRLDTGRHRDWALAHMLRLVEANGGRALVLAATASAGRHYAERLAATSGGRWRVYSQWGGMSLRASVAAWKADETSVLVGTRSLMTGVDAPGETCSLVIVDRPARAASNPVDDARVEALTAATKLDRWSADRYVYVADAQILLEQSAGRLIRSVGDSGMVAVLDPRLLRVGQMVYPDATRKVYMEALERFDHKLSDPEKALAWLRERRARMTGAAPAA